MKCKYQLKPFPISLRFTKRYKSKKYYIVHIFTPTKTFLVPEVEEIVIIILNE